MTPYFIEPKRRKYVEKMWFFVIRKKLLGKSRKKLLDIATKSGLDEAKTESRKEVYKEQNVMQIQEKLKE